MRKKNIFCKAAAGILAAALVVTSAPTNNMVFVKAAESSSQSDAASEALAETIKKAEALVETDYSTDSWEQYKPQIDEAVAKAKTATGSDISTSDSNLKKLLRKLKAAATEAEIEKLKAAVETGETFLKEHTENEYTEKSWKNYGSKISDNVTKAKTLKESIDTNAGTRRESGYDVRVAANNITDNISRLIKSSDKTKLEALIKEAENLNEEDYTADSWKDASKAISSAIATANEEISIRGDKNDEYTGRQALIAAMDKLELAQVTVGRGSFQKKLAPGTYSIPIELLNGGRSESTKQYTSAGYMKETSMAGGCFPGNATLVIHKDGTATLTTATQAIEAMGMSDAANDWTVYESTQNYLDGNATATSGNRYKAHVDKTYIVNGKKKPAQISFIVPDLKQNVVAVRMYISVMSINQDACIGLDWANIEKVSDDTAISEMEKEYVTYDATAKADVKTDMAEAVKTMSEGVTVKLASNAEFDEDVTVKGGTLDLNGYTLAQKANIFTVRGDVTIKDSSKDKTGSITHERYDEAIDTSTSIAVAAGSLTADGVALEGQIGNYIMSDGYVCMQDLPHIAVTLKNCMLTNKAVTTGFTGYGRNTNNVYFGYLDEGIDFEMDNCTTDNLVSVGHGGKEKSVVKNSKLGKLELMGISADVEDCEVSDKATVDVSGKAVVKNSKFSGLSLGSNEDTELDNVTSILAENNNLKAALTVDGAGTVTIKNGVYSAEKSRSGVGILVNGTPAMIEGGYFKAVEGKGAVSGPYETKSGYILGEVSAGEYAGYTTVVEGTEKEDPDAKYVATIYNADGSVAKNIKEKDASLALIYAKDGQTVKLNEDMDVSSADSFTFYKNFTLDLNGYLLKLGDNAITGNAGKCTIVDSSEKKTGKITTSTAVFAGNSKTTALVLDGVNVEALAMALMSVGHVYVKNGTKVTGAAYLTALMGAGPTHIYDSTWVMGKQDLQGTEITQEAAKELLEGSVRTAQYSIKENEDGSFTVSAKELGKQMRAFEELNPDDYTESSYKTAKEIYDEVDATADDDVTEDISKEFVTKLTNAMKALVKVASADELSGLNSAIESASALDENLYTAASWKNADIASAVANAKTAAEGKEKDSVVNAKASLDSAVAKLVKAGDKTALEAKIKEADAITESDYTAESYKALKDAVAAAGQRITERAAQAELDKAAADIQTAISNLKKKEAPGIPSQTPTQVPTQTPAPTESAVPAPANTPSAEPAKKPEESTEPKATPTVKPTVKPTKKPTKTPTVKVAAVKGVKVKNVKKLKDVVSWKKVSKASGYEVYRADKKKGKFKKIATIKKGSIVKYTNKKLKKKKSYFFKIRAYRVSGKKKVYGKYSSIVKVTIKK